MSFLATPRFPDAISYGSVGGPSYNTSVIQTESGYEKRNINWLYPLNSYDVAFGVKSQANIRYLKIINCIQQVISCKYP